MKLFRLRRLDPIGVDEAGAFVVRAATEYQARELATAQCGDEGASCWRDAKRTGCEALKPEGPIGVVLRSFHAG